MSGFDVDALVTRSRALALGGVTAGGLISGALPGTGVAVADDHDRALKPQEANPFIDAIIANGLIFQAFHQYYIETSPNIWFIHGRAQGPPLKLAKPSTT